MRHRRSRKEQSIDKKNGHNDMVQNVNPDAKKWMEHDAYKSWDKKPLPRYDVVGYMKAKGHDVKGEMSGG